MTPYMNPMIAVFENAKKVAANIPEVGECGDYTTDMFSTDFPQFYKKTEAEGEQPTYTPLIPQTMLTSFIDMANGAIIPSRWGEQWRYASGLYVAHFAAMYLKTYADGSPNAQTVASASAQKGNVSSAKMGDTSVSYDNGAINAGTEKWGTWNSTQYGAQLATMARMIGIGGTYVI